MDRDPFLSFRHINGIFKNTRRDLAWFHISMYIIIPDNKDHEAYMGPTWVLSAPGGPHVGPMNLAIRDIDRYIVRFPSVSLHLSSSRPDDVIKWRHFPCYWPFVRGISPRKDQWRGTLMFPLICAWIHGCANIREAGDSRRHRAHFDVTVMKVFMASHCHGREQHFYSVL